MRREVCVQAGFDANSAAGLRAYLDQAIERLRRECEPAGVLAQMALVAEEDD